MQLRSKAWIQSLTPVFLDEIGLDWPDNSSEVIRLDEYLCKQWYCIVQSQSPVIYTNRSKPAKSAHKPHPTGIRRTLTKVCGVYHTR